MQGSEIVSQALPEFVEKAEREKYIQYPMRTIRKAICKKNHKEKRSAYVLLTISE